MIGKAVLLLDSDTRTLFDQKLACGSKPRRIIHILFTNLKTYVWDLHALFSSFLHYTLLHQHVKQQTQHYFVSHQNVPWYAKLRIACHKKHLTEICALNVTDIFIAFTAGSSVPVCSVFSVCIHCQSLSFFPKCAIKCVLLQA